MKCITSLNLIFVFLLAAFVSATIIDIPADYPTIQQGINAGSNGDTVLVQPGTYDENINFNGHNITLASLFLTTGDSVYIGLTIIDGDSSGSVVTFAANEDSIAVLNGFTIRNGCSDFGGGVYCLNSDAIISNNVIADNNGCWGAGIYCEAADPIIFNNRITNNHAAG